MKSTAFRVCINSDDKHLLLDEQKWPAYVAICEWFFKTKKTVNTEVPADQTKKRRIDDDRRTSVVK